MTSPTLIILVAIAGAGKTTLTQQYINEGFLCLSAETIRKEFKGNQADNQALFSIFHQSLIGLLKQGRDVIVDNTNVDKETRKCILDLGKMYGYKTRMIFIKCTVEKSLENQKKRVRKTPKKIVQMQYDCLQRNYPTPDEADEFIEL